MAGAHTEAVLNKLSKPDLVQIILNTEANLGSQIAKLTTEVKDLLAHSKKLEADVAIVKNVSSKLAERVVANECQCWENAQYSRRDTLNRKDCLRILSVKRQLKGLDSSALDMPEGTKIFVNENLCPYDRGIWSKCKKNQGTNKKYINII